MQHRRIYVLGTSTKLAKCNKLRVNVHPCHVFAAVPTESPHLARTSPCCCWRETPVNIWGHLLKVDQPSWVILCFGWWLMVDDAWCECLKFFNFIRMWSKWKLSLDCWNTFSARCCLLYSVASFQVNFCWGRVWGWTSTIFNLQVETCSSMSLFIQCRF
jgi:hypothetical protein